MKEKSINEIENQKKAGGRRKRLEEESGEPPKRPPKKWKAIRLTAGSDEVEVVEL